MEHMSINDRRRARAVLAAQRHCGNDYRRWGGGDWGALTLAWLLIMLFTKVALRKLRANAGKGRDGLASMEGEMKALVQNCLGWLPQPVAFLGTNLSCDVTVPAKTRLLWGTGVGSAFTK